MFLFFLVRSMFGMSMQTHSHGFIVHELCLPVLNIHRTMCGCAILKQIFNSMKNKYITYAFGLLRSHTVWMPFDFESFRLRRFQMEHIRIIICCCWSVLFTLVVLLKLLVVGISILKTDDGLVWHTRSTLNEHESAKETAIVRTKGTFKRYPKKKPKSKMKNGIMCCSTRAYVVVVDYCYCCACLVYSFHPFRHRWTSTHSAPKSLLVC